MTNDEELMQHGLLHDAIHHDTGRVRAAKSVKVRSTPQHNLPDKLTPDGNYGPSHHYADGWNDAIDAMTEAKP